MFDWIVAVIVAGGLLGVCFLMFAENIVPPIPSEVIMPLAGFAAAQGDLSLAGVIAAGTVGAVAGASVWKEIGRRIPRDRLRGWIGRRGHLLTLSESDFDRAVVFFQRHGPWAVFLGRLAPTVRTFISVPAGVVHMPWSVFLLWTTLGTVIWTALLAVAGYLLAAEYRRVERWLDPATAVLFCALIVIYLWRVAVIVHRKRRAPNA
jgi:membrane protein DedA with SNARE-associated domain